MVLLVSIEGFVGVEYFILGKSTSIISSYPIVLLFYLSLLSFLFLLILDTFYLIIPLFFPNYTSDSLILN